MNAPLEAVRKGARQAVPKPIGTQPILAKPILAEPILAEPILAEKAMSTETWLASSAATEVSRRRRAHICQGAPLRPPRLAGAQAQPASQGSFQGLGILLIGAAIAAPG